MITKLNEDAKGTHDEKAAEMWLLYAQRHKVIALVGFLWVGGPLRYSYSTNKTRENPN